MGEALRAAGKDRLVPRAKARDVKLTRARVLAAGAAAGTFASIGILRWPGQAAQFTLKLGNDQLPTHPMSMATADAIKRITDASNGQLAINLFGNSALGGDTEMLSQLRSGALELMQVGNNILGAVIPAASLLSIPFAFRSAAQFEAASEGPLGAYIGAAGEKLGLRKFPSAFYGGFFHVHNRIRPIEKPSDLAGLKIRVPAGPIDVGTFKALGAAPTVVNLSEVYTALQAHLVDGIDVPLPTLIFFTFYEQVKFSSLTSHIGLSYFLFANGDAWNKLPKKLQDLVEHEMSAAAVTASKGMAAQEVSIVDRLSGLGVSVNRPAPEPFAQTIRASGMYKTWRDQFDPKGWDELEKTTGKLT
jgi:tripartite ATP-independent transporter DctP family solute receptor